MQPTRPDALRRHAALFDTMATTLGIDLEEAALSGALPFGQIADAVLACRDCGCARDCQGWMNNAATAEDQPSAAPGYCRNRTLLSALPREASA